jgi:Flp pilus assembly protein TadG
VFNFHLDLTLEVYEKVKKTRSNHAQKGQSFVELALMLVIILTLLAGAVDFGMAFFSYVSLADAAQEGALYGSLYPTTFGINDCSASNIGIYPRVRQSSSSPVNLCNTSNVTVNISTSVGACRGGTITVTVTYDYPLSMPFIGAILGRSSIPLTARTSDTIMNPKCP